MIRDITVELDGSPLLLSSHKSAFDPVTKTLYIADLHAGKSATLRAHGIPVPEALLIDDLQRLTDLINHYAPDELIILGDFFHARSGKQPEVFNLLHGFRAQHHALAVSVIVGNHDKHTGALPGTLQIRFEPEHTVRGNFILLHFPEEHPLERILCGHLHPAVRVPSLGSLPCFVRHGSQVILPSFGSATGCSIVSRQSEKTFYIIGDGNLFQLP